MELKLRHYQNGDGPAASELPTEEEEMLASLICSALPSVFWLPKHTWKPFSSSLQLLLLQLLSSGSFSFLH